MGRSAFRGGADLIRVKMRISNTSKEMAGIYCAIE
jgi:hypothetical protein